MSLKLWSSLERPLQTIPWERVFSVAGRAGQSAHGVGVVSAKEELGGGFPRSKEAPEK